jgi:hypothetical protein
MLKIDDCRKKGIEAISIGRDPVTSNVTTKLTIGQTQHGNISTPSVAYAQLNTANRSVNCPARHTANMSVTTVVLTAPVKCTLQAPKPWRNLQDCNDIMHVHIRDIYSCPSLITFVSLHFSFTKFRLRAVLTLCWYKMHSSIDTISLSSGWNFMKFHVPRLILESTQLPI